jgi:signal transduction histidine kinase
MDSYPGPLGQVIANLVGNALVHAFDAGKSGLIRIEARILEDGAVLLSCADTGKGMPPDVRKRVFEPFFTTSLGKGGSGLGLYIAHNLVTTVLGGGITVHPVSSGGTRFEITLPIRAPKEIGSPT